MLIIVLLSFLIMSATGITGVIIKKTKLKTKLPFLPFLLMGEVVFLIIHEVMQVYEKEIINRNLNRHLRRQEEAQLQ